MPNQILKLTGRNARRSGGFKSANAIPFRLQREFYSRHENND